MKQKPFPKISGVQFKSIPGGYAVSDDGKIWISKGGRWRQMEPYQFCDGEMAVWLTPGGMKKIKDLMKVFDNART